MVGRELRYQNPTFFTQFLISHWCLSGAKPHQSQKTGNTQGCAQQRPPLPGTRENKGTTKRESVSGSPGDTQQQVQTSSLPLPKSFTIHLLAEPITAIPNGFWRVPWLGQSLELFTSQCVSVHAEPRPRPHPRPDAMLGTDSEDCFISLCTSTGQC